MRFNCVRTGSIMGLISSAGTWAGVIIVTVRKIMMDGCGSWDRTRSGSRLLYQKQSLKCGCVAYSADYLAAGAGWIYMYCTRYQALCIVVSTSPVQLHRGPGKVVMVSGEILSLSLQVVIGEKRTEIPGHHRSDSFAPHVTFMHIHDQWRR
jgi:hypothetical protein